MAEKKSPSIDEILKQVEDFENTVSELSKNIANLKRKLMKNKEVYGPDMSKWPEIK